MLQGDPSLPRDEGRQGNSGCSDKTCSGNKHSPDTGNQAPGPITFTCGVTHKSATSAI